MDKSKTSYWSLGIATAIVALLAGYRGYTKYLQPTQPNLEITCVVPSAMVPIIRCTNSEIRCYVFPGGVVQCSIK